MRDAFRRLAEDDWVLGIAAAIALAYSGVLMLAELADVVLQFLQDVRLNGSLVVGIGGRDVYYGGLLPTGATFAVVVLLSAWLLQRARDAKAG